jgi:26S proteasome regulatory subunit N5
MEVDPVEDKLEEITIEVIKSIKLHDFDEAIDELHQLEKKYRTAGDAISIGRILTAIVELHFDASNFIGLNESIIMFTLKKHLQSDQAIGMMLKRCCDFVDATDDRNVKMKLLETLKHVTDGKLYAEMERAKICRELSAMRKTDGDISAAIKTLEDLKIDTLTTLDRKQRIEIILQLMELLVESKEHVKCLIVAKKINKQYLDHTPEYQALKIKFYKLSIEIDKFENYLNTSRHYQAILDTEMTKEDASERQRLLTLAIVYCILAPFDNEKFVMMGRLIKNKFISEIPLYRDLLKEFTTIELINWYTMKDKFKEDLLKLDNLFNVNTKEGLKCWKDFRTATIEHNIKVFATYYERAYLSHMSEFLDINVDETEKHLCNLIVNKSIKAKIDRLTGIVTFNQHRTATEKPSNCQDNVLNNWLQQVSQLMKLVDNTSHLINKEVSEL